jgi:hypothetical protein
VFKRYAMKTHGGEEVLHHEFLMGVSGKFHTPIARQSGPYSWFESTEMGGISAVASLRHFKV